MKKFLFLIILLILVFVFRRKSTYEDLDEVYILRAHKIDEQTTRIWEKMLQELPEDKCFMIFDNTNNTLPNNFYSPRVLVHTEDDCKKMNSLHQQIYNTVEATVVLAYDALPIKPDFVWFIENDVYCDGNFAKALNTGDTQTDFMASHVRTYDEEPDWGRFKELTGEFTTLENNKKVRSLFPVIRCSKKMIELLKSNMGKSGGYCEAYFPTLANVNGLLVKHLPKEMLGKFDFYEMVRLSNLPNKGDNKLHHKFVYTN